MGIWDIYFLGYSSEYKSLFIFTFHSHLLPSPFSIICVRWYQGLVMRMGGDFFPACNVDRSWPHIRRSQGSHVRSTDALDIGFWSDVRRTWVFCENKDDDMPYMATILDANIVAVNQDRWHSCRACQPGRVEFLGSTDELYPHHWTAHSYRS